MAFLFYKSNTALEFLNIYFFLRSVYYIIILKLIHVRMCRVWSKKNKKKIMSVPDDKREFD